MSDPAHEIYLIETYKESAKLAIEAAKLYRGLLSDAQAELKELRKFKECNMSMVWHSTSTEPEIPAEVTP